MQQTAKKIEADDSELSSITLLPKRESLYEIIFRNLTIPAVVINRDHYIICSNSAFNSLTGSSGLFNHNFFDYVEESEHRNILLLFSQVEELKSGFKSIETCLVDPINKRKKVEINISYIKEVDGLLITIPERVIGKSEIDLKQKTDDLENLFYLISHNLKSPIISIQGFTKLLLESKEKIGTTECLHFIERIQKNASRLSSMVLNILTFSKVSQKKSRFTSVSLLNILTNIKVESIFQLKKKRIEFKIAPDLPSVWADQDDMNTLFLNLIDNSIKYMVDAKKPFIEINWEEKPRFYVISVSDNGMGVDPKYHESVFKLFERANVSSKIEGTGVGLAIVKRIVEKHGGYIRLTSRKGGGTTVYFTIPR